MKYPIHPEFTLFEFTLIRILHSQQFEYDSQPYFKSGSAREELIERYCSNV
jgi:hypothetical protein